eukprot:192588_1
MDRYDGEHDTMGTIVRQSARHNNGAPLILFAEEPSTALTSNASMSPQSKHRNRMNHQPIDTQFINESTIQKRNAVFNVFETAFLKSGYILYYVEPLLPSNVFNYTRCWFIGIKILRKKGGANLLVMSCNRAPFVGALAFITCESTMISNGIDVIPRHTCAELTKALLRAAVKKVIQSNGDEKLPHNIVITRSSGSQGLIKQIVSKEVSGFKQSLYEFQKTEKSQIKRANNGSSKWYPGIICSILQENVPDAFGVNMHGRNVVYSNDALVINRKITSKHNLDVFLSIPASQEQLRYGKTMRLIILFDEYNHDLSVRCDSKNALRHRNDLLSDYIALIYSSLWCDARQIPFPKQPTMIASIKASDHAAQWQWGILTESDTHLSDIAIDVDSAKPKICIPHMRDNDVDVAMKDE